MIKVDNLTKTFNGKYIFNKTNLIFENGMIYAITGLSGSGKTTLMNMLSLLEPYDSGEIFYNTTSLKTIKPSTFFRNTLGYLFQNFGLLESGTIRDNLDLGLIGKKFKKSEKNTLEIDALKKVKLDYLNLDQPIFELSGGEAQRVALAKLILKDPPLILADEPTAALDPSTSKEILDILISLRKENRIIIIATHNPLIWESVDQIIKIQNISNIQ